MNMFISVLDNYIFSSYLPYPERFRPSSYVET